VDIKNLTKSFLNLASPQKLREWIDSLLNKVEELSHLNQQKDNHIERLEAQNRRLQGLPAKPKFDSTDVTSDLDKEDEDDNDEDPKKKTSKKREDAAKKKRRKKKDLKIDETKKISVDPNDLDATFEYKGSRKVVVQDIHFKRNNIAFELEKYYSKEYRKTVEADLPTGYDGGYFGPNVITFIKCSYYEGDVTIKKIKKILTSIGIKISARQINRIINDRPDDIVSEMRDARIAAIEECNFQQIDDTSTKLLGLDSVFTIVTCNSYFTNLYTTVSKCRSEAIMALSGGDKDPLFKLNLQSILVAFTSLKSLKIQLVMEKYQGEQVYTEEEVDNLLNNDDFKKFKPPTIRDIKTAMLVGAFYDGHLGITGEALVSDDAPQFNNIYDDHVLCWYHEMRHYKKLDPVFKTHAEDLKEFFKEIKSMYQMFKKWLKIRSDELRDYIFEWFTDYFIEKTGYKLLDDRKNLTFNKMGKLLAPLFTTVSLPLENNESERDLRGRKIKLKISLFDRSWQGVKARDFYIGLKQTCRKNGVSFYKFLLDRQTKAGEILQLAEIIKSSVPQS